MQMVLPETSDTWSKRKGEVVTFEIGNRESGFQMT